MNRWRAVVFDLDDTLYPEWEYVRGGFEAAAGWVAEALGGEPRAVFGELWSMFQAGVRGDTFDRWLRGHGHAVAGNREAMIAAYRGHSPVLALYPDVGPALEALRGRVRLGLITEGPRQSQETKLAALRLPAIIDRVIILGEEDRAEWKPSPRSLERWLEGTGIAPDEAVYLGDNPVKDFLGARRAGWASIRVRRADSLHRDEEPFAPEAAPDFELPNLQSLIANLRSPVTSGQSSVTSHQSPIANRQSSIANHQSPIGRPRRGRPV